MCCCVPADYAAAHSDNRGFKIGSISQNGVRRRGAVKGRVKPSFPDVQLHIVDAPLGAGPESILTIVVMDSGLALTRAPE
jgi:hypothetical protein